MCSNLGLTIHIVFFFKSHLFGDCSTHNGLMAQLPRSTPQSRGKVQGTQNWFSGHRHATAQPVSPVIQSLPVSPADKSSRRSTDLLGMAGLRGRHTTSAITRSGSIAAADFKALQPWKIFVCWGKPPKQPRVRALLSHHQSCCIWGHYSEIEKFEGKKGEGPIQSVLQAVCYSSLLQLYTSSHTSSTFTKANFLQRYLILFIKNKVNEGSKIRYFKRHVIVPFCCHNKERYFKSTLLSWIQI